MPLITFLPSGRVYRVRRGGSLLRAALRARIPIARACRGDGVCAACRVQIVEGQAHLSPMTEAERRLATMHPLGTAERYACQAVAEGDVTVTTAYWGGADGKK